MVFKLSWYTMSCIKSSIITALLHALHSTNLYIYCPPKDWAQAPPKPPKDIRKTCCFPMGKAGKGGAGMSMRHGWKQKSSFAFVVKDAANFSGNVGYEMLNVVCPWNGWQHHDKKMSAPASTSSWRSKSVLTTTNVADRGQCEKRFCLLQRVLPLHWPRPNQ